jgi:23S rRNA (pseudouridine1915-N3)-methyltransferase
MLNIKVICIGKVKEASLRDLINEYLKRLSKYSKVEIIELQDEKLPLSPSPADEIKIKEIESNKIIEKIEKIGKSTIFALDLTGKDYSSEDFSKKIQEISTYESSTIVFIIGGSLGMTDKLLNMCDYKICFSKMTFPHQLIRVFLLEQVFRAFKIQNNETYHH